MISSATPLHFLPALSYSMQDRFHECRWAFRAERLWKLPAPAPDYLVFGRLEHLAIQGYINHLIVTKQERASHEIDLVFNKLLATLPEPVPEHLYTEALRILKRFAKSFRLDLEAVWKPEAQLAIDVDGRPCDWWSPAAFLRGIVDLPLLYGSTAEIVDWKTGRIVVSEAGLYEDLQAQTYALLLMRWNPRLTDVRVRLHFVRLGIIRSARFSRQELEPVWQRWLAMAENIYAALAEPTNEKLWKPTPGVHCTGCAVAVQCPVGLTNLKQVAAMGEEHREEIGLSILATDAGLKLLKDRLKASVKAHGPLDVNGMRFDFWPEERYEFRPIARVMKIAEKHFIEPTDLLKADTDVMKRLRATNRPFIADLEAENLIIRVGGTTFRAKKLTGAEDAEDPE